MKLAKIEAIIAVLGLLRTRQRHRCTPCPAQSTRA
jgi:hypothetical protein